MLQDRRINWIVCLYALSNLLNGCISYDKTMLYKKGYKHGNNDKLELNGYYQTKNKNDLFPIFFYKDGSVIFSGYLKDTIELKEEIVTNPKSFYGYWGNYKISGDTISIELMSTNINALRQERNLRKGIIKNRSINFYQKIDRNNETEELDQVVEFVNFNTKPDSTANWIRKKKKYNR